jgi:hypothetical protein
VFGTRARVGGGQLVRLILEQPACANYVAGRLITWFEGVEPDAERLRSYADFLVAKDWQMVPFLRRLFLDPAFYRDEVFGARVASPVDFMVGAARRLGLEPPGAFLAAGSQMLGQALLQPPSVKGWDEGTAWITTASLMMRGNLAAVMLGLVDRDSLRGEDSLAVADEFDLPEFGQDAMMESDDSEMDESVLEEDEPAEMMERETSDAMTADLGEHVADGGITRMVRALDKVGYRPSLNLSARFARRGLVETGEVAAALVEELLAIEPTNSAVQEITAYLRAAGDSLGIPPDEFLSRRHDVEPLLRRAAHLVLALPEAQLH